MIAVKQESPREVSLALHTDFGCRQDRTENTQFRTSTAAVRLATVGDKAQIAFSHNVFEESAVIHDGDDWWLMVFTNRTSGEGACGIPRRVEAWIARLDAAEMSETTYRSCSEDRQ